jgi:hypothetical protein
MRSPEKQGCAARESGAAAGVEGCDPTLKNRGRSGKNTARFDSNTVKL